MRCFLGIKLNQSLVKEVREIKKVFRETGGDIKFVKDENLHFTVKFFGDIEPEEAKGVDKIKNVLEDFDPFRIELKGTGVFPSKDYIKVIWIGVGKGEEKFTNLLVNIDNVLYQAGFEREKNEIIPHLTVGRVKSGKNKKKITEKVDEFVGRKIGEMKVEGVTLFKSDLTPQGPVYEEMENYRL